MDDGDRVEGRWCDVDRAGLEQMLASGLTPASIADEYGRSASLVRKAARRWGLDARALRARSTGLAITHPSVAAEFVAVVRGGSTSSTPSDLATGSGARCRWRCLSCRHQWVTSVSNRTGRASGCPRCARARGAAIARQRTAKTPSIGHARPDLAAEFVENLSRADRDVHSTPCGSHDRVHWRCSYGHTWETTARQRAKLHTQCPVCLSSLRVSRLEYRVASIVTETTGLRITVDKTVPRLGGGAAERIDLSVDELDLLVDLDPTKWHSTDEARARDARKAVRLSGRRYVRIRPPRLVGLELPNSMTDCQVRLATDAEADPCTWAAAVISVISHHRAGTPTAMPTGPSLDGAIARADEQWRALRVGLRRRSLLSEHPAIAAELVAVVGRPTLTADHLPPAGDDRGSWLCASCGATYEARVANRTRLGTSCPSCSARRGAEKASRPRPGASFADAHPCWVEFFRENLTSPGRTPAEMKPSSTDRCMWTCPYCLEPWEATPHSVGRDPRRGCRPCGQARSARARRNRLSN